MKAREKILRRVALKCADFARQLSFHQALAENKSSWHLNFWIYMHNNTIDLAVLDWAHLFGSDKDDLHWKNVATDVEKFRAELLEHLGMEFGKWAQYRETIMTYRDKDVAHIEVRPESRVPDMSAGLNAANYYYFQVLKELKQYSSYEKWPTDLIDYHNRSLEQSRTIAKEACSATYGIDERVY